MENFNYLQSRVNLTQRKTTIFSGINLKYDPAKEDVQLISNNKVQKTFHVHLNKHSIISIVLAALLVITVAFVFIEKVSAKSVPLPPEEIPVRHETLIISIPDTPIVVPQERVIKKHEKIIINFEKKHDENLDTLSNHEMKKRNLFISFRNGFGTNN